MHVLRKSYKQWSAGTQVTMTDGYFHIFDLEIPDDLVVRRRPMTAVVPLINSRQRRRNKKAAMKALGIEK